MKETVPQALGPSMEKLRMHGLLAVDARPHARKSSRLERTAAPPIIDYQGAGVQLMRKEGACACGGECALCKAPYPIETKLSLNEPGDEYEREADQIADSVTKMPEARVQRACACGGSCPECQSEELDKGSPPDLQTKELEKSSAGRRIPAPIVHEVLRSPGHPLDGDAQAFMESRFGYDFSSVRIHTDAKAAESATALRALAYTYDRHVVFGPGRFDPSSQSGRLLLAHELAHVVQQTGGRERVGDGSGMLRRQAEAPAEDQLEEEGSSSTAEEETETPAESEDNPQISAIAESVAYLEATVREVTRDQGTTVPGRTTEVGSTNCNPDTGQPEWRIDRTRIPRCMWPCAERHEETHAEFIRSPCERVWLPIERARFWVRIARQYAEQGNLPEVERAMREAEAAVAEGRREVQWYLRYMEQTCRYDEGAAYEAGIELCDTAEARQRCADTGETAEYTRHMATWRRFMQNPPNCPAPPARPRSP